MNPRWFVAGALLAALGSSGCLGAFQKTPTVSLTVRDEQPDENYFVGNLTWHGDHGGIAWGDDPTSDRLGGPAPDPVLGTAQRQGYVVGSTMREETGDDPTGSMPADDVFVSDPVPRDLHLNVTRLIQLDLLVSRMDAITSAENTALTGLGPVYVTPPGVGYQGAIGYPYYNYCPADLDVELTAGDTLVAGGVAGQYFAGHYSLSGSYQADGYPTAPEGFVNCIYRMPSEAATIPAGTQLHLRIVHVSHYSSVRYLLEGDPDFPGTSQSQLRLPLYSPDEWFFRDPAPSGDASSMPPSLGAAPAQSSGGRTGADATPAGAAIAGLWASAAGAGVAGVTAVRGDRKGRAHLLVLLLLAVALSGCASHEARTAALLPSAPLGGHVDTNFVKDNNGLTSKGRGTILGVVHDELSIPVRDVHISLLGRDNYTDSVGGGRFKFANLSPGVYDVRFTKDDFRSFETQIEVRAGLVSRPDITIYPTTSRSMDFRPHYHDLWGSARSVTVMDTSKQPACDQVAAAEALAFVDQSPCQPSLLFTIDPTADRPVNTVQPGTYELDVTLSWDAAGTGVPRLGLLARSNYDGANYTEYLPRAPDQPFHIQTSWETADSGHQKLSGWQFITYLGPEDYPGAVAAYERGLWAFTSMPTIHIKAVIQKGVVPLEPPHPDHWGKATSLVVMQTTLRNAAVCNAKTDGTPSYGPDPTQNGGYYDSLGFAGWGPADRVVPQGTRWLEVTLNDTRDSNPQLPIDLLYRPANGTYSAHNLARFEVAHGSYSNKVARWVVPVTDETADDTYVTTSHWHFYTRPTGSSTDELLYCADLEANGVINGRLAVVAHREAPP